jgi:hypothetical protein
MATYYVSGVWKDGQKQISHLFTHLVDTQENSFGPGTKRTEQEIMTMYAQGDRFNTIVWHYGSGSWTIGENIKPVLKRTGGAYLRTEKDGVTNDNLDKIVNYEGVIR